jgi:threonine dehydratase
LTLVPPYDDERIMAGQGTAALELVEDVADLDVLVAPVGGGGLLSGCAVVAKAQPSPLRVVGVEPEAGDDVKRSLDSGARVTLAAVPQTIADGQQTTAPGVLPFEVLRTHVDEVVLVTDDELVDAMAFCFDRLKLVTEPSGACGVAALLAGRLTGIEGARIGIIVSGGNVGSARFAELLSGRGPS